MKCERHTKRKMKPNDFKISELTFIEHGMVDGTTIKRRIALCRECYKAYKDHANRKSG